MSSEMTELVESIWRKIQGADNHLKEREIIARYITEAEERGRVELRDKCAQVAERYHSPIIAANIRHGADTNWHDLPTIAEQVTAKEIVMKWQETKSAMSPNADLIALIAAAITAVKIQGAEEMREKCAIVADRVHWMAAERIRALPTTSPDRQEQKS